MTIHYHGTPITPNAFLLSIAGAHFCVSFSRPTQVRLAHECGQSVMLDNGAFSAWRMGQPVADWQAYYEWADQWLDYPTTWAVMPDVIAGDEAANDQLVSAWPHGDRGAPVWHMHESLPRLLRLLDTFPRVCMGSSGEYAKLLTGAWQRRMDEAWRAIDQHHRRTPNVHMLRGMQMVGRRWPFASLDSTDLARNHNIPGRMGILARRQRWDARQCRARFDDHGEQGELVA